VFDFINTSCGYWRIGIRNDTQIADPEKAIVNFGPLQILGTETVSSGCQNLAIGDPLQPTARQKKTKQS
jgi:hypothetical protein